MNRPEVRLVQSQEVQTTQVDLPQSEVEALLAKYGHKNQKYVADSPIQQQSQNLTFDEMVRQQEEKDNQKRLKAQRLRDGAKPTSFDAYNMNYSETKYTSLEIDSSNQFGMRIEIVSDMKIPK